MSMKRADVTANRGNAVIYSGGGTNYVVQTPSGVLYQVFVDGLSDIAFIKSTDGGISWSVKTVIFAGTVTQLSVWYDRWSNISAGLIHCAYTESVTDDTLYRTIDTESSDALSTETTIFAGSTTASGGHLSITRAVGGNVYCKTCIDAGAEGGFYRLLNANVPNGAWDAARTADEMATQDMMILLPDYDAADTQDIMAIFWDGSANELSRKLYDDSGDSWSETSIATSMTDYVATNAFPNFAVAMDIANTQHILVAWSNVDTASASLRCWTIDSSTITEKTAVVSSSTDDQALCAITLDTNTGYWWVVYAGKTDGSETWQTSINLYCKSSTDGGTTWGAETLLTTAPLDIRWVVAIPRTLAGISTPPVSLYYDTDEAVVMANMSPISPRSTVTIGLL